MREVLHPRFFAVKIGRGKMQFSAPVIAYALYGLGKDLRSLMVNNLMVTAGDDFGYDLEFRRS